MSAHSEVLAVYHSAPMNEYSVGSSVAQSTSVAKGFRDKTSRSADLVIASLRRRVVKRWLQHLRTDDGFFSPMSFEPNKSASVGESA